MPKSTKCTQKNFCVTVRLRSLMYILYCSLLNTVQFLITTLSYTYICYNTQCSLLNIQKLTVERRCE